MPMLTALSDAYLDQVYYFHALAYCFSEHAFSHVLHQYVLVKQHSDVHCTVLIYIIYYSWVLDLLFVVCFYAPFVAPAVFKLN